MLVYNRDRVYISGVIYTYNIGYNSANIGYKTLTKANSSFNSSKKANLLGFELGVANLVYN